MRELKTLLILNQMSRMQNPYKTVGLKSVPHHDTA